MRDDCAGVVEEVTAQWAILYSYRVEKGVIRMDETRARREHVGSATMLIAGEYSSEIPPQQIIKAKRKDSDKKIVWLPGETLPRYARRVCADMRIDVACGDVRYYRWSAGYGAKADRPLAYLRWWVGPSADDLDLSMITMEVRYVP
jgi:hypothetical protein